MLEKIDKTVLKVVQNTEELYTVKNITHYTVIGKEMAF